MLKQQYDLKKDIIVQEYHNALEQIIINAVHNHANDRHSNKISQETELIKKIEEIKRIKKTSTQRKKLVEFAKSQVRKENKIEESITIRK